MYSKMRSLNARIVVICFNGNWISDARTTKLVLNNVCNLLHSRLRRTIFKSTLCFTWMSVTESLFMHFTHSYKSLTDNIITRDEFHPVYTLLLMCDMFHTLKATNMSLQRSSERTEFASLHRSLGIFSLSVREATWQFKHDMISSNDYFICLIQSRSLDQDCETSYFCQWFHRFVQTCEWLLVSDSQEKANEQLQLMIDKGMATRLNQEK
jgi:hypothetical protein